MRSLVCLVLVLSSGCSLWFTGDGGGDDVCALAETSGAEPTIAPAPLRDPGDLTCDSFGSPCNTECGPCPAATGAALAPIPSWGYCGHACEQLGESACAADPACRVAKDAACTFGPNPCFTDFLGCFPLDQAADPSIECHGADAWDCSRNAACTAIHAVAACPGGGTDCPRPFELCVPEGTHPGTCQGVVTCDRIPPSCPAGTTPGISGDCYTGACIPTDLCSPSI